MTFRSFYNRKLYLVTGIILAIVLPIVVMFLYSATQSPSSGSLGIEKKSGSVVYDPPTDPTYGIDTVSPSPSATPTPKASAKPKPKPKPEVTKRPVSRSVQRSSAWVEKVRLCIIKRESGGNYRAQNKYSTASGAYQFINSTWEAVTGLPGPARNYSKATQDRAFYKLFNNGKGKSNWNYPPKQCW